MTYDGHGRLKTRKLPVELSATSYSYNTDDTLEKVTDLRGASASYSYNGRHLVTGITYFRPESSGIPTVGAVAIGYDEAGNRQWVTDGQGRTDYGMIPGAG